MLKILILLILNGNSPYKIIEDIHHKLMIHSHYFIILGYVKHENQDSRTTLDYIYWHFGKNSWEDKKQASLIDCKDNKSTMVALKNVAYGHCIP